MQRISRLGGQAADVEKRLSVKSVSFAIGVALAAMVALRAVAADRPTAASDLRQNLFSVCYVSDQDGLMVGDLGRLFRTADGGKTWHYQSSPSKRSFVALACPDKSHVWAVGQAGEIIFSNDGGVTWKPQQSGTERQLLDVAFATPQRGIAVGDFGTLIRTEDAGATWTKVPLPPDMKLPPDVADVVEPGDVVLYAATFADAEHGWAVGEFGVILATTDGGSTWHPQTSPIETSLFGVSFADAQRGWAVGIESTLLTTTDGGTSWQKTAVETPKGFAIALYDVQVRGNYGWAVGNNGYLLNSKDAGATWQLVKVPLQMGSAWLRGITLFPDGRGVIVGARGLVLSADRDKFTPSKERL